MIEERRGSFKAWVVVSADVSECSGQLQEISLLAE